jgi:hypothetical protein
LTNIVLFAQDFPSANDYRHIRIGDFQDRVSAYGGERAWNNTYYEGKQWPAQYLRTDNFVIKRTWFAIPDFTDANGVHWNHWGNNMYAGYVDVSIFPIKLQQISRFDPPAIYVDGNNTSAPYAGDVDVVDPTIPADRIVVNTVNTSAGLTITRKIMAFSQQYHDDYFIKVFTYKNTGNTDYDDEIELTADLKGVRIGAGTRYSVCREAASYSNSNQAWGKYSWVTRRGEDYAQHADDVINFTESTPIDNLEWIRCGFSWLGHAESADFDNIGAPIYNGNGRLTAPQFAGSATIHVDKSVSDKTDDPSQPVFLGWHAGDTYPGLGDLRESDMEKMGELYDMLAGTPYGGDKNGGTNRYFEDNVTSLTDQVYPYKHHGDGGGTNVMLTYGPFDIPHGDSIVIVEVEAVNGLSRTLCEDIGYNWLKNNGTYQLPPDGVYDEWVNYGGTTTDRDLYKNAWVYTGVDSILQTFSRAIRNYNMDFQIPQAPEPPLIFDVASGGDKISLSWKLSESEGESNFAGYRIYRAIGKKDTVFQRIAEVAPGVDSYDDRSAVRGQSYYYYISAYSDGSLNSEGIANPTGSLESGKFYTMTNRAASLKRKAGEKLSDIRVVPNPYNIRAEKQQYVGNPDKIMFLDIPAYCTIKIYTERGDLVETIHHNDGSGDESWNSLTSSRQEIVSGVYIAYFEVTKDYYDSATQELLYKKGQTAIEKFVVIR